MKSNKLRLLFIILCCKTFSFAQNTNQAIRIINSDVGNGEYKARDEVRVIGETSVTSTLPGQARLFIDEDLILYEPFISNVGGDNNTQSNIDFNPDLPVEELSYSYDISDYGTFNTKINIELPDVLQSLKPYLSLEYSTNSNSGSLGFGWSINGLMKITREPSSNLIEGLIDPVDSDQYDTYFLNGTQIIKSPLDENIIRLRNDFFTKIEVIGAYSNPSGFKVYRKNGTIEFYGYEGGIEQNGSGVKLVWHLVKIQDLSGNYIEYKYRQFDNNSNLFIDEIKYTGNIYSLLPTCRIKFLYTESSFENNSFCYDFKTVHNKLIREIKCEKNGQIFRKYSLNYVVLDQKNYLKSIIKKTQNDQINPIQFEYKSINNFVNFNSNIAHNLDFRQEHNNYDFHYKTPLSPNIITLDLDGDGSDEIFINAQSSETYTNGNMPSTSFPSFYIYKYNKISNNLIIEQEIVMQQREMISYEVGDFNNDGKMDLLYFTFKFSGPINANNRIQANIIYCNNQNQIINHSFLYNFIGDISPNAISRNKPFFTFSGDFNGDKMTDFGIFIDDGTNNGIFNIDFENLIIKKIATGSFDNAKIVDYNGDGVDEILFNDGNIFSLNLLPNHLSSNLQYSYNHFQSFSNENFDLLSMDNRIFPCKFNNDNLTDLYIYNPISNLHSIYISTGKNYQLLYQDLEQTFNCDLVDPIPDYVPLINYISNEFNNPFNTAYCPDSYNYPNYGNLLMSREKLLLIDVNGDGLTDFLQKAGYTTDINNSDFILINTGNGFIKVNFNLDLNFIENQTIINCNGVESSHPAARATLIPIDLNGDKQLELFYSSPTNWHTNKEFKFIKLDFNNNKNLSKIIDSYSKTIEIDYENLFLSNSVIIQPLTNTNSLNFSKPSGFYPTKIIFSSGNNSQNQILVKYGSLVYDKINFISKGFNLIEKKIVYPSYFTKDVITYSFEGLNLCQKIMSNTKFYRNQNQINSIDYEYSFHENSHKTLINNLVKKTVNNLLKNTFQIEEFEYSATENNLTKETIKYNNEYKTTVEFSDFVSSGSWINHLPSKSKTSFIKTTSEPCTTLVENLHYYDNKGNTIKNVKFNNSTTERVYELFEYNIHGLITKRGTSIDENFSNGNFEEYIYDDNILFVEKKKNSFNHEINYISNNNQGYINKIIDENGITTEINYDSFGNIGSKKENSNIVSEVIKIWASNFTLFQLPSNASFVIKNQITNKLPIYEVYDYTKNLLLKISSNAFGQYYFIEYKYDCENKLISESYSTKIGEMPVLKQFIYDNSTGLLVTKNNNGIIETNSWNSNDRKLTTLLPNGKQIIKYLNTKEQIVKIESYTGTINFELDAIGNQTKITTANGVISRIYNLKNQLVQEIEPSRGTLNNTFDKFGRLTASFDSRGESSSKIEYSYDLLNRLTTKTIHSANQANTVYSFNYDNSENGIGKLSNITGNNQLIQYEYDHIARLKKQKVTTDNISFEFEFGYNNFNQVISKKLPDNTIINYEYSNYNIDLLKVNEGAENNPIFELQDNDAVGRMKDFKLGENITINKSFDYTGNLILQRATKNGVASFNHYEHNYSFDLINNNLMKDEDLLNEKKEIYEYDSHERLTKVFNGNINISDEDLPTILNMDYAENGNIQNKTDIGDYEYQNNRLKKVSNDNNQISTTTQNITYSSFNKPTKVIEGSNEMEFTYNCFDEKIKTVYKIDGNVVKTTYYLPDFQKTIDESQIEKTTTFIKKGRLYMAAIVKTEENSSTIFINADRLGSISQIFDNTGNLLQEFSYDAWGKQTITQNNTSQTEPLLNVGYTGHEHLTVFNLIDMKGRFYDPQIGQMLSPDPLISEIENAQTYNKYSYVFNNPFKYTDPTGYYGALGPGDISLEEERELREREQRELAEFEKSLREEGINIGKEIVIDGNEGENAQSNGGGSVYGTAVPIALTAAAADGPLPIGDIIGGVILAGATAYDATQRTFVTYTMRNAAGKTYVGRTSGYGDPYRIMMNRYYGHHMRAKGYGNPVLDRAVQGYQGYPAIRGREQQLIDFYGGVGSPSVGNSIRGVGYYTDFGQTMHNLSNLYFGPLAPYTGFWK